VKELAQAITLGFEELQALPVPTAAVVAPTAKAPAKASIKARAKVPAKAPAKARVRKAPAAAA